MRLGWLPCRAGQVRLGLALLAGLGGCAGQGPQHEALAARLRVASVAEASGQPDVALSVLAKLASTAPENADVQARYAKALIRAGNVAEAEQVTTQALRRRPGNAALLRELGNVHVLNGRPAEALEVFQAVLRASPREVAALSGRGVAFDLLGQHVQAQASYRAALAIDPQHLPTLNNLALSYLLAGRPQEAITVLEPLVQRADAPERVRNNLAGARAAAGNP